MQRAVLAQRSIAVIPILALAAAWQRHGPAHTAAIPPHSPHVTVTLAAPHQVFRRGSADAMGLFNVPDMHTAVLQRADKSYLLWITGNIGPTAGAIARLSTTDFVHYENAGPGGRTDAEPVMEPSCRTSEPVAPHGRGQRGRGQRARGQRGGGRASRETRAESCLQNYDADYVGANTVLTAENGKDLLMLYEAGNKTIGDTPISHGWEFNVIALAHSTDEGRTWKRDGVVLSGSDPKPTAETNIAQPGISEMGAVVADGFIYAIYQFVPNTTSEPEAPSVIQVARAPLSSGGAPGTWSKYYEGSFSQPGLGGRGSTVVATGAGTECTRPVQVWPVYSSYLKAYVLTFLCNEGWFFSTSTDLVTWTPPTNFMPMTMWQHCKPMDWNFVLVTPGNPAGVIGETGYVLYAHTDSRGMGCPAGFDPHELWIRPFRFSAGP